MNIRIQALHFDATETLQAFIQKKLEKLNRFSEDIKMADVTLKVTKPEVSHNKDASIKLVVKGDELFAEKQADTFEEAIDVVIDALKRQLEKRKDTHDR